MADFLSTLTDTGQSGGSSGGDNGGSSSTFDLSKVLNVNDHTSYDQTN